MTIYHLGQTRADGVVGPACGAPASEPVLTAEDLRAEARRGQPVCDRCVAIATQRAQKAQ
ncbi:MAG: hypothetical protein H6706_23650 [Myxococcales bacterium]|nr:hypothetical protein [Myxococcales bacterium]